MIPTKGICVDGSCLGNPGKGEYRGVDIETKKILFEGKSKAFSQTTNNIMEFCGIVHALKYRKENQLDLQIYSDSEIAIAWVGKKKTNSSLVRDRNTASMYQFIDRCERWLIENTKNSIPLNKWITKEWGEIPADFGNKNKAPQRVDLVKTSDVIRKDTLREWIEREVKETPVSETQLIITITNLRTYFNL